jgi:hypothetical protein
MIDHRHRRDTVLVFGVACALVALLLSDVRSLWLRDAVTIPTTADPYSVSLARFGDELLLCNYKNLLALDPATGAVRELVPPVGLAWNPTGVETNGREILLAGYQTHLVLELAEHAGRLSITSAYSDPSMVSPEGVAFSPDKTRIAVADYDGCRVHVFSRSTHAHASFSIPLAHAVAWIDDETLIATSLGGRGVFTFRVSPDRLEPVTTYAPIGAFSWPTGLSLGSRGLLVTDAWAGQLTPLRVDLSPRGARIGTNGPGVQPRTLLGVSRDPAQLSKPYAALEWTPGLWIVADTYAHRLVEVDESGRVSRIWRRP